MKKKEKRNVGKSTKTLVMWVFFLLSSQLAPKNKKKKIKKKKIQAFPQSQTWRVDFIESPLRRQEEKHTPEQADDASQVSTTSSSRAERFI